MSAKHDVVFHDAGRKAANPPAAGYEEGLLVDLGTGARRTCTVDLPYPAAGVGAWEVRCRECGIAVTLTAAGRIDDPRRLILPCGGPLDPQRLQRRPWIDKD